MLKNLFLLLHSVLLYNYNFTLLLTCNHIKDKDYIITLKIKLQLLIYMYISLQVKVIFLLTRKSVISMHCTRTLTMLISIQCSYFHLHVKIKLTSFSACILFILCSASCGTLLGSKECSWGPSYWCSHARNAKACGAVQHCLDTVWSKQIIKEDSQVSSPSL